MFEHVVVCDHLDRKAENAGQEQAVAHGTFHERGRGLVDCEIAVQEVHALAEHTLDQVIGEDEHLGEQRMLFEFVEGRKQVFMALEQLAHISSIREA